MQCTFEIMLLFLQLTQISNEADIGVNSVDQYGYCGEERYQLGHFMSGPVTILICAKWAYTVARKRMNKGGRTLDQDVNYHRGISSLFCSADYMLKLQHV
jgi:hypothetical protein